MKRGRWIFLGILALLAVGCNTDPDVAKRKYVENGNKYFERGKYKEASIMYRNALKKDKRFGVAYYHLGLTEQKLYEETPSFDVLPYAPGALEYYRRAIDGMGESAEERRLRNDSRIRIANTIIASYRYIQNPIQRNELHGEASRMVADLVREDPQGFDTLRLEGSLKSLDYLRRAEGLSQTEFRNPSPALRAEMDGIMNEALAKFEAAHKVNPDNPEVVLVLASALTQKNRFEEAERMIMPILDKESTTPLIYDFLVGQYRARNRNEEATKVYRRAIQAHAAEKEQLKYWVRLAALEMALKQPERTRQVLDEYLAAAKDKSLAYLTVGNFYRGMGDVQGAIRNYEAGEKAAVVPGSPVKKTDHALNLAQIFAGQQQYDLALAKVDGILKEDRDNAAAVALRSSLLLASGDRSKLETAISELEASVGKQPDNAAVRYELGRAYFRQAEWAKARIQFREALRLRPDLMPARASLAETHLRTGEFAQAETEAMEAMRQPAPSGEARVSNLLILSAARMGLGKRDQAREVLTEILQMNPNSVDALRQMAFLNFAEGRHAEAEQLFLKAYQLQPDDLRSLQGLVETMARANQLPKALALLNAELQKAEQGNDKLRINRLLFLSGNTAVQARDYQTAITTFQRIIDSKPTPVEIAECEIRIGEVHRYMGDFPKALDHMTRARKISPENTTYSYTVALLLDAMGRRDEAISMYEEVLRREPGQPVALNNLAFLLAETGRDIDRAMALAEQAKQRAPNNLEISDTLGWVYLKKQLHNEALTIFQQLVKQAPENPSYHYHLAMALQQKGNKAEARQAAQAALQRKPGKELEADIQRLLGSL